MTSLQKAHAAAADFGAAGANIRPPDLGATTVGCHPCCFAVGDHCGLSGGIAVLGDKAAAANDWVLADCMKAGGGTSIGLLTPLGSMTPGAVPGATGVQT
eukprot:CAMPEP_0194768906 /NCGR_PEP_ID=MMETSP0323_2-20130528/41233_1 /TAXON_ID=2866 ORGANISM="Crypthecodinium cohnii, Strain Seligo" /NCGR_SAMPLE_ID=MMETSP0323_2 /ASSEMBLY_ACC=CAM_ASM_000346 /LENGTH=99 /DNA_ID=CAMNT_0039701579 /DNA_START=105 /DNA_END=401 /DNA_ORIENTATION=+